MSTFQFEYRLPIRAQKLYFTDDGVLRHAKMMPDGKKIQSFQLFFYFFSPDNRKQANFYF